nr:hypothetical protein [Tanacetum cinerariifolium]
MSRTIPPIPPPFDASSGNPGSPDVNRVDKMPGKKVKEKSEKCLLAESFDWDDEFVSSDDEGSTKIKEFIAIIEDKPSVGKADARSCQWVDITMKKDREISSKKVVFTKADESSSVLTPDITSNSESECDS